MASQKTSAAETEARGRYTARPLVQLAQARPPAPCDIGERNGASGCATTINECRSGSGAWAGSNRRASRCRR
jgi:hypothetical protein